jgi:hypothetical protein
VYFSKPWVEKAGYTDGMPWSSGYDKATPAYQGAWQVSGASGSGGVTRIRDDPAYPAGSGKRCIAWEFPTAMAEQASTRVQWAFSSGLNTDLFAGFRSLAVPELYMNWDYYFAPNFIAPVGVGCYNNLYQWMGFPNPSIPPAGTWTGGAQLMLQLTNGGQLVLRINQNVRIEGVATNIPIGAVSNSDFEAGGKYNSKWVHFSIYIKYGTSFKSKDGTVKVWLDDELVFNRDDIETHPHTESVDFSGIICTYGWNKYADGCTMYVKNLNCANTRFSGGAPVA